MLEVGTGVCGCVIDSCKYGRSRSSALHAELLLPAPPRLASSRELGDVRLGAGLLEQADDARVVVLPCQEVGRAAPQLDHIGAALLPTKLSENVPYWKSVASLL